jgi:peptide-methionine (S)-S-oxide reductase
MGERFHGGSLHLEFQRLHSIAGFAVYCSGGEHELAILAHRRRVSVIQCGMRETATFGGGCFWCLEAVYKEMAGVLEVDSGYMGGHVERPSYESVCTGRTGHAEVVQLTFDPEVVSYGELLNVFFAIHDPTTLDRQGNDVGPQYRSVIFFHTEDQRAEAEAAIERLEAARTLSGPVVTQVVAAAPFHAAEDYHRDYYANFPAQPYCAFVVAPKLKKARQKFGGMLKGSAAGASGA